MAKNVRISDDLYALARAEAVLQDRSIAQQLEHWAKRGLAGGPPGVVDGQVTALDAAVAFTRQLDIQDVREGKRSARSLHFIPRSMARQSKPEFPPVYKKS